MLLLNFAAPTEISEPLTPDGTEPDLFDGQSFISIIRFRFENVRLCGMPMPGHANFTEINLRFYVRRLIDGNIRRGVVCDREIAPRRAVAIIANWLYNEHYLTRRMQTMIRQAGHELAPGDRLDYAWRSPSRGNPHQPPGKHWNHLSASVTGPLVPLSAGSLEEFIVEHYWGYSRSHRGRTIEYKVKHPAWRVAPAADVVWDCEIATTCSPPLANYLCGPLHSAIIADGSPVEIYAGQIRCPPSLLAPLLNNFLENGHLLC